MRRHCLERCNRNERQHDVRRLARAEMHAIHRDAWRTRQRGRFAAIRVDVEVREIAA